MRKSSCINGLDEILCGGFIANSTILVAGETGSGKTNLCLHSLFEAAKNGETCAFISLLSESKDKIIDTLSNFSFYDQKVIDSGKLTIHSIDSDIICKGDFSIFEYINENLLTLHPTRVVIDPITIFEEIDSTFEERQFRGCELRTFAKNVFSEFEERNIMLMITGEIPANSINSSKWPYMVDTVLSLDKKVDGNKMHRYLEVIKTRRSEYIPGKHAYSITTNGINMIRHC